MEGEAPSEPGLPASPRRTGAVSATPTRLSPSPSPYREAFFPRGLQEAFEKFRLDECKGCGETVRLVKAADLRFDPGWLTESREKLIRNEQFKEGGTLCHTRCLVRRSQQPASNKQGKHRITNPRLFTEIFNFAHDRYLR